jgi:hypothetical protein
VTDPKPYRQRFLARTQRTGPCGSQEEGRPFCPRTPMKTPGRRRAVDGPPQDGAWTPALPLIRSTISEHRQRIEAGEAARAIDVGPLEQGEV